MRIDSADLFANITLEATGGATLATTPGAGTPVLTIQGTPGVSIRGFTLETSGAQHAVEITGACPGIVIENCLLRTTTPLEAVLSTMYLHGAAAGTEVAPIQLRNLRIEAGGVGIVVGGHEESEPVKNVVITECQIRGATRGYGIPIVLMTSVSDVKVSHNLLSTGTSGINLAFAEAQHAVRVEVSNNTFHNLEHFLGLSGSLDQNARVESNLIVESDGLRINEMRLNDTNVADVRAWFSNNWWERNPGDDDLSVSQIARVVTYVPLRSREWGSSEFLAPTGDAPPDLPGRFKQQDSGSSKTLNLNKQE